MGVLGSSGAFLHRVGNTLDATDSLFEGVICLIVVIGTTSATRYAFGPEPDRGEILWYTGLLVLAWSVIDSGFVLLSSIFQQGRSRLAARQAGESPQPVRLSTHDWVGALATLLMSLLVCVPAVVPFLLPLPDGLTLWLSNGLAVATLFWLGWFWARWTDFPRWLLGLGVASIGVVAVAVTLVLGVA